MRLNGEHIDTAQFTISDTLRDVVTISAKDLSHFCKSHYSFVESFLPVSLPPMTSPATFQGEEEK